MAALLLKCGCTVFLSGLFAVPVIAQTPLWRTSPETVQVPERAPRLQPPQNQKDTPPKGDWAISCNSAPGAKGLDCQMSRSVLLKKPRKLLLKFTVTLPATTKKPAMLIQMPLGLYLPGGAQLTIDDNTPMPMVIQTCDQKGCYAGAPVTDQTLKAMKKGNSLKVTFQNLKKKPIAVAVPLDGFTRAYEQMERR